MLDTYILVDMAAVPKIAIMEVDTTCPGIQFYAGNFLGEVGKGGVTYGFREGIALETQFYPDSVHHDHFPSPIFCAGEIYRTSTEYTFYE